MKSFTLCVVASALVGVAVSSPGGFAFLDNLYLPANVLDAIANDAVTKHCFADIEKAKTFTQDALTGKDHTSASCNDAKKLCSACHSCDYFTDGASADITKKNCICVADADASFVLGPKDDCVILPAHGLFANTASTGAGDDCIISVHTGAGAALDGGAGDDVILILNDGQRDTTQLSRATGGNGRDCIYLADDISLGVYGGEDSDIIFIETNIGARGLSTDGAFVIYADGEGGDDLIIDKNNLVANQIAVLGSSGNDVIRVQGYAFNVSGGLGQDDIEILAGGAVYEGIYGNEGNDRILIDTGAYAERVWGGAGNDYVVLYENVQLRSSVEGEDGDDYIYLSNNVFAFNVSGGAGDDKIINFGYVRNYIKGEAGEDLIFVGSDGRAEYVEGGDDDDELLVYGKIRYAVRGNDGDDHIVFSGYAGTVEGNTGEDSITINGGVLKYDVDGGDGDDDIVLNSGNVYRVYGGGGDDEINQYSSAVVKSSIYAGTGNDQIYVDGYVGYAVYGGDGADAVQVASSGVVLYYVDGNTGDDDIVIRGWVGGAVGGGPDADRIIVKSSANVVLVNGEDGNDYIKADVQVKDGIYGGMGMDECVGGDNLDKDDIACEDIHRTTVSAFPGRELKTSNHVLDGLSSSSSSSS